MSARIFLLVVFAIMTIVLSGCNFEFITKINSDGSGELVEQIAVNFSSLSSEVPEDERTDPSTDCENLCADEIPELPTSNIEKRDGNTWCTCAMSYQFDTLDELDELYEEIIPSTVELPIIVDRLRIDDERLYYDLRFDIQPEELNYEDPDSEILWRVVLPGTPIEHNADEVEGNTLTWDLRRGNALQEGIHAVIEPVNSPFTTTIILTVSGLAIVAASVVIILIRRSRQAKEELQLQSLVPKER